MFCLTQRQNNIANVRAPASTFLEIVRNHSRHLPIKHHFIHSEGIIKSSQGEAQKIMPLLANTALLRVLYCPVPLERGHP